MNVCSSGAIEAPKRSLSLTHRSVLYNLAFVTICAAMAAGFAGYLNGVVLGVASFLIAALAALAASDTATNLLDQIGALVQRRRIAHQLDYATEGLPDDCLTAIVVPMLLQSRSNLDKVIALAERNFLMANDSNVVIVLLADFVDAVTQEPTTEEDQLLGYLGACIATLNASYPARSPLRYFHVLARHRVYSAADRQWRGYERKRGKLEAFTELVTGGPNAFFNLTSDDAKALSKVKYALCIDEDTKLIFNTVQNLVGVLDHPLNAPRIESVLGSPTLVGGHVAVAPAIFSCRANLSWHRWPSLIAQSSIDADARSAVEYRSMLFDIFGVELNRGKVLYNLRSYAVLSKGRYPEGVLLSHDTIESAIMHPTFAGNALIAESVPDSMLKACLRFHRWMRGDMQNALVYLCGIRRRSDISLHWKFILLHQLRNQVLPGAGLLLALVAIAYACNGESRVLVLFWVAVTLPSLCVAGGTAIEGLLQGSSSPTRLAPGLWFRSRLRRAGIYGFHLIYHVMCIPLMTVIASHASATAIVRTVTGKNLLEWNASSVIDDSAGKERLPLFALIATSMLSVLVFGVLLLQGRLPWLAGLALASWAIAPVVILQVRRRAPVPVTKGAA